VKFSGQVTSDVKLLEYGIDIRRVVRSKVALGIADGWVKADGKLIYEAKDLLRASQLSLLPRDNVHVAKDLAQVHNGHKLSPVLIVRGKFLKGRPLVVADGYHRVCASYWIDENAQIPCRLVDAPS